MAAKARGIHLESLRERDLEQTIQTIYEELIQTLKVIEHRAFGLGGVIPFSVVEPDLKENHFYTIEDPKTKAPCSGYKIKIKKPG